MDIIIGVCTIAVGLGMSGSVVLQILAVVVGLVFFVDAYLMVQLRGKLEAPYNELLASVTTSVYSGATVTALYIVLKVATLAQLLAAETGDTGKLIGDGIGNGITLVLFAAIRISYFLVVRGFKMYVMRHHTDAGGQGFAVTGDPRELSMQQRL